MGSGLESKLKGLLIIPSLSLRDKSDNDRSSCADLVCDEVDSDAIRDDSESNRDPSTVKVKSDSSGLDIARYVFLAK